MIERLKEYGQNVLRNMGYGNVELHLTLDGSLDVDGSLILLDYNGTLSKLDGLRERVKKLECAQSPVDTYMENFKIRSELAKIERLLEISREERYEVLQSSQHSITVKLNSNESNKEDRKNVLEHELGHYYLLREHPKFSRFIGSLRTPEKFLNKKSPHLFIKTLFGISSLSFVGGIAILSIDSLEKFAYVPIILLSMCFASSMPCLIEEDLADHYGERYSIK